MKAIKVLVLLVLVIGLFQVNLFSIIYSRVQGVVQDESGQPIVKAIVSLLTTKEGLKGIAAQQETDTSGKFKFDDIISGEYFLQIFKEGYAAFGPLMNYERIEKHSADFPLFTYRGFSFSSFFDKEIPINTFHVKEGQVKHLVIKLQKEAVLVLKVTPIGAAMSNEFTFKYSHSAYSDYVRYLEKTNEYRSYCLGSGKVDVIVYPYAGFPDKEYTGVEIKSGQTTTLEYVIDFTKGQVIHGFVIDKETKKPAEAGIGITSIEYKTFVSTETSKNGEYWIGGISPGKYKVFFGWYKSSTRKYDYETIIDIAPNEKKEFNVEI